MPDMVNMYDLPTHKSVRSSHLSFTSCNPLARLAQLPSGTALFTEGNEHLVSQERKTSCDAGVMGRMKLGIHQVVYRSQET